MQIRRLTTLAALIACGALLATPAAAAERDMVRPEQKGHITAVIRITDQSAVTLPDVRVAPGTTVVWINQSSALVEISFPDKPLTLACSQPVNFIVHDDVFVSNKITPGAVASICFIETGRFSFEVRNVSRNAQRTVPMYRGTVAVH